jgi:hypothetical protein
MLLAPSLACQRGHPSKFDPVARRLTDLEIAALGKGSTISLAPLYYGGCDRPSTSKPRNRGAGDPRVK